MPKKSAMVEHGAAHLAAVKIESYSLPLTDGGGFIGDRASRRAFLSILDGFREKLCETGNDPFGDTPTGDLSGKDMDAALKKGDALAAGLIHTATERFAQTLAGIIRRFRQEPSWARVQRVAVGGGMRDSRIGEIAIGRTTAILRLDGIRIELVPIRSDPDEAALIGAVQFVPADAIADAGYLIAVDIGGSSIRAGLVRLPDKRPPAMRKLKVTTLKQWRYGAEEPQPGRDAATKKLAGMLEELADKADGKAAPVVAIACPGRIDARGHISDGAQNLPGDWEADGFNLADEMERLLPEIGGRKARFLMHNDAVLQGLSEVETMQDVKRWAIVTIGTGLGNAVFVNTRGNRQN